MKAYHKELSCSDSQLGRRILLVIDGLVEDLAYNFLTLTVSVKEIRYKQKIPLSLWYYWGISSKDWCSCKIEPSISSRACPWKLHYYIKASHSEKKAHNNCQNDVHQIRVNPIIWEWMVVYTVDTVTTFTSNQIRLLQVYVLLISWQDKLAVYAAAQREIVQLTRSSNWTISSSLLFCLRYLELKTWHEGKCMEKKISTLAVSWQFLYLV